MVLQGEAVQIFTGIAPLQASCVEYFWPAGQAQSLIGHGILYHLETCQNNLLEYQSLLYT